MEIYDWIDRSIAELENDKLYKKYFEGIALEKGIDVLMLFNPSFGIDLILTMDQIVKALHLFSGKEQDIQRFSDQLPFNLNFDLSKDQTRSIFGEPHQFGGGDFSFLYGITPNWDKYFFENFDLHFQFSEDETAIDLITIGSLKNSDLYPPE
jgi:hypothetical protein